MRLIHPNPPPNRFGDCKTTAKLDHARFEANDRGAKDDVAYIDKEMTKLKRAQPGGKKGA